MFERFTEEARQVVVVAQEEARTLGHDYIGTEHLLLGLMCQQAGLAAAVLASFAITLEQTRGDVVRIVGRGEGPSPGQIPFTPQAKKALELSLREAMSLRQSHIGPEHLLLGLVSDREGVAVRILLDHDADQERVRGAVIGMLTTHPARREHPPQGLTTAGVTFRSGRSRSSGASTSTTRHLYSLLSRLEPEIRSQLHREPDAGDALQVLASIPDDLISKALARLSVDPATLHEAIEAERGTAKGEREQRLLRQQDEQTLAGIRRLLGLEAAPPE